MAEGTCPEDVTQSANGIQVRSEASFEPSIAPSEGEQPLSSPVVLSADATGRP